MLRQLHFSELDLVLHSRYRPQPGATVFDSEEVKRVAERTTILKPLPEDRQALPPCCYAALSTPSMPRHSHTPNLKPLPEDRQALSAAADAAGKPCMVLL